MFESDDEQHQSTSQGMSQNTFDSGANDFHTSPTFAPIEIEKGPMVDTSESEATTASPTVNLSSNVNKQFNLWDNITSCFNIDTYKRNFDVNTHDIKTRLVGSLLYFNVQNGFNDKVLGEKGPDVSIIDMYFMLF